MVRVVDGDTLIVRYAPKKPLEERVTLLGLETPKRGKPGHKEARKALERLVGKGRVALEFEGGPRRTLYGSLPAYLRRGDRVVNVEMVRQGWSRFARKEGEKSRYAGELSAAEAEARKAKAGLWATGGPPE